MFGAIEMNQQEITGLSHRARQFAVTQSARRDKQLRSRFLGQPNKLYLAFGPIEDGMVKTGMIEFIGYFKDDV